MDRKLYLELCQKASVIKNQDKNENLDKCIKVVHKGVLYIPVGYELLFENGQPRHRAILRDLGSNSINYANLERVENL